MKNNKLNNKVKIIAIALIVSLMVTLLQPISVLASSDFIAIETHSTVDCDTTLPNTKGDLTIEQLENAVLPEDEIPEYVSEKDITEKGHANRLYEQEPDDNTVIFQNRDGTKTAYFYSSAVKYKDKNGKTKDKKNKISKTADGDYTNPDNDINALFPKKLNQNKGVELKFDEYVVEVSPAIKGNSGASRKTGHNKENKPTEYVEYPDVFDDGISVRYTPTFEGYKEDIILNKPSETSEFSFIVNTNGLSLSNSEKQLYLTEPSTGEVKASFSEIYVYDSFAGENDGLPHETYDNEVVLETIKTDSKYKLTIKVNKDFLNSADTVYPVYVDPSLAVMSNGDIDTAAIYSSGWSYNTDNTTVKIGYENGYGIGRGLFNFPIFHFNNDFMLMYGNQIKSANLNLFSVPHPGNSSYNDEVGLSMYEFHSTWSPSTVNWNNTTPNNYGKYISGAWTETGWISFNILYLINKFKTDSDYTLNFKGVMIKAGNENGGEWKKLASSTYPLSSENWRPYIDITYNDSPPACPQIESGAAYYLTNNIDDYLEVYNLGTADNTRIRTFEFHGNLNQQFRITNITGGEYEISPLHTTGKILSVNSSGQVIIETDQNLARQRWYIYYRNGTYHIVNKQYSSGLMEANNESNYVDISDNYDHCCWELEKAFFGVAWEFKFMWEGEPNCLGYALNLVYKPFVQMENVNSVTMAATVIEEYVTNKLGRRIRRISGPTAPISSDEYRFCLRVRNENDNQISDYHVWVQTNTGAWCEKNGTSQVLKEPFYVNPSTASWDMPYDAGSGQIGWITNFYNSDTIYFAATLS